MATPASPQSPLGTFDEDAEINDDDLDQSSAMSFFATGSDGKVIKLHERVASIPISMMGQQFQQALEEEIKDYSDDQVRALAPFDLVGRGIAGIDEMRAAMCASDDRVQFGMIQIEIGEGTFKRYKNVFVHFQGDKMKALKRAQANRKLAAAKDIIGHTHASLIVPNAQTFTVEWLFKELKNAFTADNIAYKGKGKQSDINSLKVNYKLRMQKAAVEAAAERKRLEAEQAKLLKEAQARALEEERERLEALKREMAQRKREELERAKAAAEEERRLRKEREEQERLQREAEEKAKAAALGVPSTPKKKRRRSRKRKKV